MSDTDERILSSKETRSLLDDLRSKTGAGTTDIFQVINDVFGTQEAGRASRVGESQSRAPSPEGRAQKMNGADTTRFRILAQTLTCLSKLEGYLDAHLEMDAHDASPYRDEVSLTTTNLVRLLFQEAQEAYEAFKVTPESTGG
jgi:hypothetical protein